MVSETEKFSGYQKEKMNFSILELKSFVEYILFNNSTADRVKFDLKSSEVVYQDTNFDNVIKTRKRLKELESDGVVKNVKNDSINLEKTIYYTTKF